MAQATATLIVTGVDNTQRREILNGTCALSATGTYATNGIPLPWNALVSGEYGGRFPLQSTAAQPLPTVQFFSLAGGTYQYGYDMVHNTLRIIAGGAELAAGAAITADTIGFRAEFLRGV